MFEITRKLLSNGSLDFFDGHYAYRYMEMKSFNFVQLCLIPSSS